MSRIGGLLLLLPCLAHAAEPCNFIARNGAAVGETSESCRLAGDKPCPQVRQGAGSYRDSDGHKLEVKWKKGFIDGPVSVYDGAGKLLCTMVVENGSTQGVVKELYPSGKLKRAELFGNSEAVGPKIELTESGRVVELECGSKSLVPEDKKPCGFEGSGVTQFVSADGRERNYRTTYKAGKLMQIETTDDKGRKVVENATQTSGTVFFPNGKPFRQWSENALTEWFEDGTMELQERYDHGRLLARRRFFANGEMKYEATLDQRTGLVGFRVWRDDASLAQEGSGVPEADSWDELTREGAWRDYAEDGRLAEESRWHEGELEGMRRQFWPDGGMHYEETFQAGKRTKQRCINAAGKVSEEEYFPDGSKTTRAVPDRTRSCLKK
jgi:antitoxin component YwqK of YwqJK toxin-antitoxin module